MSFNYRLMTVSSTRPTKGFCATEVLLLFSLSGRGEPDPGLPGEGQVASCRHDERGGGKGGAQEDEAGAGGEKQHVCHRDPVSLHSRENGLIFGFLLFGQMSLRQTLEHKHCIVFQ